jgi:hypothetical protein
MLLFATYLLPAQVSLRGIVTEKDSATFLPFAYIICKSSGNGTMSDHEGRFAIVANTNDTIICSYMGYLKGFFPVQKLAQGATDKVVLSMITLPINLAPITVTTFKIKPYEREYMNDMIDRATMRKIDYVSSPISALYMQYSKEGRQVRKLSKIFEQILIEEEVQKKLSREILTRLTGDDAIDYNAFRKYCYYVSDYYIVNHDGVELYSRVMDCYRHWKQEKRDLPPQPREREKPQN